MHPGVVEEILRELREDIVKTLLKGDEFQIIGIGKFKTVKRKSRPVGGINEGQVAPESIGMKFVTSRVLKNVLNGNIPAEVKEQISKAPKPDKEEAPKDQSVEDGLLAFTKMLNEDTK